MDRSNEAVFVPWLSDLEYRNLDLGKKYKLQNLYDNLVGMTGRCNLHAVT